MSNEITGWTPVATVEEADGVTFWEIAEHINDELASTDAEVVFLDELFGPIHLAYRDKFDEPTWENLGRFEPTVDAGIDATDDLAKHVPEDHKVVEEVGVDNKRHLVYVNDQ